MNAPETLAVLREIGVRVRLADDGENIKYAPASRTPPRLVEAIKENKPEIKRILGDEIITSPLQVRDIAREVFGLPPEDREPPPPKPPKGRDPFVWTARKGRGRRGWTP